MGEGERKRGVGWEQQERGEGGEGRGARETGSKGLVGQLGFMLEALGSRASGLEGRVVKG